MSVKVPSGDIFGIWKPAPYIESDFLYDPMLRPDNLIQEYLDREYDGNPYRGIVLNEDQKGINFCEDLNFRERQIPIFSAQTDYTMCQANSDCAGKNQAQCTNLSQICKRIP